MPCHSHLPAIYTNLANAAFGGDRDTDILAVGNEEIVDGKPILLRKFFTEYKFSLVRILRFDISPTIGNPMNVGIHTDARFFVPQGYYQIRRLAPHTIQFQQLVNFVWYPAVVFSNQYLTNFLDLPCLCPIEPDGVDEFF